MDDRSWLARINAARERWRDGSLTLLLAVQILTVFGVVPLSAQGLRFPPGAAVVLLLVFMSLTIFMASGRWTLGAGVATLVAVGVSATVRQFVHGLASELVGNVIALAAFVVLSVVVFRAVFRAGRFTNHRVRGAVVLYLNLGLLFSLVHRMVAELQPGSYAHIPGPEQQAAFRAALNYFSFSTLTSVGYGDIIPVSPLARSLATLEATMGQLLPTILIARVVMLAMKEE